LVPTPLVASFGSSATVLVSSPVAAWFESFAAPTAAQARVWPAIQGGRHTLVAAPTGSGKTLAAFLAAIDALVRQGLARDLRDETQVVYVSPLKALSNDIQRNLEAPLAGIRAALRKQGLPEVEIRTWVRTGDTEPGERARMCRRPPHIVVTTPESLHPPRLAIRPRDARDHPHRDRRRDPRAGAEQARHPSRARSSVSTRSAAVACCASAFRPRRSQSRRWRASSWARARPTPRQTAPSSIPATAAPATSRSKSRMRRSKR
jgi:hypothetical protein